MRERMIKVETNVDEKEKGEKKNNTVIRGIELQGPEEEEKLEKIIKDKLNIDIPTYKTG